MPIVVSTTMLFKAGMMLASKPAFIVLVAAIIFLTIVGPLPLRLLVLLTLGLPLLFLFYRLKLLLFLLLLLLRRLSLLLLLFLLVLLFFLTLSLLLLLLCRLGFLLLLFGFSLLLLSWLSLLLLFRWLSLFLLCVCGSKCSEKKEQNPRADKPNCFHKRCLLCCNFLRPSFARSTQSHPVPAAACLRHFNQTTLRP